MPRTSPPSSFRELYRDNYGFVWHAARRFGVADAELDDAVQDTFVAAYRRLTTFRDDGARSWLYGIARRVASNYRRTDHRRTRRHDALAEQTDRENVAVPRLEALHSLETFMQSLDDDTREVFVLAELEGMSGSEVASALAMPVSTTYDRIRAARAKFSAHLQDRGALARARAERPAATERSWSRLVLCLPAKGLVPGAAGWGAVMKLAATTASGVAAILWVSSTVVGEPPPATLAPPADDASRPVLPGVATNDAAAELPKITVADAIKPTAAPQRSREVTASREDAPPIAPPRTSETAWLSEAAERLAAGDAVAALELTDRHAREFRSSALADVRAALRIESLCKLGKAQQGRAEAKQLLAARPSSPVAMRVQSACEEALKNAP